jgi:hypothetical protein
MAVRRYLSPGSFDRGQDMAPSTTALPSRAAPTRFSRFAAVDGLHDRRKRGSTRVASGNPQIFMDLPASADFKSQPPRSRFRAWLWRG